MIQQLSRRNVWHGPGSVSGAKAQPIDVSTKQCDSTVGYIHVCVPAEWNKLHGLHMDYMLEDIYFRGLGTTMFFFALLPSLLSYTIPEQSLLYVRNAATPEDRIANEEEDERGEPEGQLLTIHSYAVDVFETRFETTLQS